MYSCHYDRLERLLSALPSSPCSGLCSLTVEIFEIRRSLFGWIEKSSEMIRTRSKSERSSFHENHRENRRVKWSSISAWSKLWFSFYSALFLTLWSLLMSIRTEMMIKECYFRVWENRMISKKEVVFKREWETIWEWSCPTHSSV